METEDRHITEEIKVAGKDLLKVIRKLIREGNARTIILWSEDNRKLLEIPVTGGVLAGGALLVLSPFLVAIGAIAATVKHVRVEIIPRT